MSVRRIIRAVILSLAVGLALFVLPSVSRAASVLAWTTNNIGLFISTVQYPTLAAWNAGAAAAHVSPGAFAPTGLIFQAGFNITNNDLIIDADNAVDARAAYSLFYQAAAAGYNGGWAGNTGLYSNSGSPGLSAASDPDGITGIGVVLNDGAGADVSGNDPAYTSFDNDAVNVNSVLVKFTYYGDTDLDGIIEPYDVSLTESADSADEAHGPSYKQGWANGESDYSGTVDSTDVSDVQDAYLDQAADPIVFPSDPTGSVPRVPEPGSVLLAAIGTVGMIFVRRRYSAIRMNR